MNSLPCLNLMALLALAGCATGKPSSPAKPLAWEFTGVVESVAYLSEYEGQVYVVDVDPRYVMTVKLTEPLPPLKCASGQTVHFAFHSPTMLFHGSLETGKAYSFRLWRSADDKDSHWWLKEN
jgi:hypothetical protein